ncbi:MAG: hypothetical protein Q4B26_12010 [Eubacteriales bacterium]|nr:hypothetical protein [Eubacteriales bacterium]
MKKFKNWKDYERWTNKFENCSEYDHIPTIIDDGFKIAADFETECKNWKTAVRRFEKTFKSVPELEEWFECIRESCENGFFKDITGWQPCGMSLQEIRESARTNGAYSWGVEEVSEGCWYIFINVSGCYIGRQPKIA